MSSITYDGQSFVLDGKRIWLVSGSICYARLPRALWAERIHAAKQAGLNTIETPVIWARHEARAGQFDFTGDNDLRHFVELIGKAGMMCILRPGPFVGAGWDLGGLPPWVLALKEVRLRANGAPFLEACSRYITAVAGQVRDLQIVSPSTAKRGAAPTPPGPIVLIQSESGYTCGHDGLALSYLGELDRYYREAGFAVPIVNTNDLWQSVEGEIDGWTGFDNMLSHLRQLGAVRPDQPRLLMDARLDRVTTWGAKPRAPRSGEEVLRALVEVLAAGGQFNLTPFHGGTHFGFSAGRDPTSHDAFRTTGNDSGAPLTELGEPGVSYSAVRRVCSFASHFGRTLSHIEPRRQPVALVPTGGEAQIVKANAGSAVSVIHTGGAQGGVVYIFGDQSADPQPRQLSLLLPDGSTLPVEVRGQSAVWCLLDVRLAGRAQLDYCNICAFALVGKTLVCFGHEGSRAILSINGAPFEAAIPGGKTPLIEKHEGITLVIASTEQIDTIFPTDTGVHIGVKGIDVGGGGDAIHFPDQKSHAFIDAEGVSHTHKAHATAATASKHAHSARPHKVALGEWACSETDGHCTGTSARFASIPKPADLVSLGSPYGYGWYRIKFASSTVHKARVIFPQSGHRLHLTLDGEAVGLVGIGPGAEDHASLALKKKQHTLVILAENLGRASGGTELAELVGVFGHPWVVSPFRVGKPHSVPSEPVNLLAFRAPLWNVQQDDTTDAARMTWEFKHARKTPIFIHIAPFGTPGENTAGIVLLNDKPIHYFQWGGAPPILLDVPVLSRGKNVVQIAMSGSTAAAADHLAHAVSFSEGEDALTAKSEWSFAKWEMPKADTFDRAAPKHANHAPLWWRAEFTPDDSHAPLVFDAAGLSKGQIYVNDKHIGRYFVATASRKHVPPQVLYHIPRAFVKPGEANRITLFDEHGFSPARTRLSSDSHAALFEA